MLFNCVHLFCDMIHNALPSSDQREHEFQVRTAAKCLFMYYCIFCAFITPFCLILAPVDILLCSAAWQGL